ncbi:DNA polymerase III subunit gamma and tau, partial [Streptomyces sp. S9]|nr:DNA polymerase III subunit gamma and tau [Streptomyces sp. S9]
MSGWITLGLGTAAALCPLPGGGGPAVAVDTAPAVPHVVVCADDDGWVEIGGATARRPPDTRSPRPAPPPSRPPVRPAPAPGPADDAVPAAPSPSQASPPERVERPAPAPDTPPQ